MHEHAGWGGAAPILRVADVSASVRYYTEALGFSVDWAYPTIVSVSRGHCTIFLSQGDQTSGPTWVWIGVPDVQALHEELRSRGAHVRQVPTNFEWALEMQISDPDCNVLRIGSEPLAGAAQGPWLDATGRVWSQQSDGSWLLTEPP